MASEKIVQHLAAYSSYIDKQNPTDAEEMRRDLENTTTLYVGNLSFHTTEEQIYELFSKVGEVKRVIMGLDRNKKTPCGFCFVEYYTRKDAESCMKYVNGTKLDDRIIRTDWDRGYKKGRELGRGRTGGQVRDDYRQNFDIGRGGWGAFNTTETDNIHYSTFYDRRQTFWDRGKEDEFRLRKDERDREMEDAK